LKAKFTCPKPLYCFCDCRPILSNILLLTWILFLSSVLIIVADYFFCPALEVLADYFKMPANVAGATLLSFGNGAPDVFTQMAVVSTVCSILLLGLDVILSLSG
jgi:solute carrier family 24 (sodium/potassium/calcium exchanger), member 6